jgi:valyl-tRNA synthetase
MGSPNITNVSMGMLCMTGHAVPAVQMVVERKLRDQGIDRRDMGREAFEQEVCGWGGRGGGYR